MIGMFLKDPASNIIGPVTAVTVMADGKAIARIVFRRAILTLFLG